MKLMLTLLMGLLLSLATSHFILIWLSLLLFFSLVSLNLVKSWNHVFLMLLNLELLGLIFIMTLSSLACFSTLNSELFFIFFTFAVCEASLGIAILISFSHTKGNESMYSLLTV